MENVLYSKMFDTNTHRHQVVAGHGRGTMFIFCFMLLQTLGRQRTCACLCWKKIVSVENMVIEAIKTLLCYCGFWREYVCLILNFARVQRTTEVRAIEAERRDIVFQYANFR